MTHIKTRGGFTLIEILMAFGILALVMGVVYSSVTSSLYATRYVEERAEVYHAGRQIISRLSKELESAYLRISVAGAAPATYTFFKGEHDQVESRRMDKISFTTLGHRMNPFPPKEGTITNVGLDSEFAAVSYFWKVDYGEDQKTRVSLFFKEGTRFVSEGDGEEYEVVRNLKELDIRYFEGNTGAWVDEWDSQRKGVLPTAVDVSVVLADSNGVEVPFRTLVPLVLAK